MAAKTFSKTKIKKGKPSTKSNTKKQTKLKTTSSGIKLSKNFFNPKNPLPVVYQPNSTTQKSKQTLIQWIKTNKRALTDDLKQYGAILFRGFEIISPQDFEEVILNIDSNLKNNYLGTSPRNQVTKYIFTATELPSAYPIMQHAEMSFLDSPPKKLFFYCGKAPGKFGETPITDLRKVLKEIPTHIREKFEKEKIRYSRVYNGPSNQSRFQFWKTKRWDEMFQTKDKNEVEKTSKKQNFKVEWFGKDDLRLVNTTLAIRKHPESNTLAWHNHSQVFHIDAARKEYWKIFVRQKTIRGFLVAVTLEILTFIKKITTKKEYLDTHCTYGGGQEISGTELKQIQNVFWNNISLFSWQNGDILVIDNYSVSHGRHPFTGPREIFVAWAD
ncbi:taurine catabolism dioxygenase, TauD/TfdA family [Leptospira interrogans serovar Grippotyphosa str. UI 12769]|uniref:TauD/TfdA family dioxygenase n=1 Tax=Leptospira interrogans TaxID=173 RepID=UPI000297D80D|nr:TauD/TfdA family dioxygenase [Leptospira interrogans]EKR18896.1 taurine catabolism dioxygenase, TauD/TfdA family [Leptospira interrogans serovar Pyrogenes str. 2006006960]EMJ47464.1 taurine catabolism dioxygenase, TauD/TfdA family [Leptospira interrogans str. UT126]EMN86543.1 taurine catabolism dioxygenase, TauD/TfdA family [Leptospira interrogans serovar Grippotyphosa str. UI 12769]MBE0304330.1 taurine dioxygenase [Leptospira interrogans serovar Yeoncheon]MCL8310089.1 TauD/TfdA family diox